MCGRYTLRANMRAMLDEFGLDDMPDLPLRFNIAPTTQVAVVRQGQLSLMRWGLVPSWAKDLKISSSLINARAGTVATKPSFRSAFKKRRCLIPADGWYEWQKLPRGKQPWWIHLAGERVFAFAGLWEGWYKAEPAIESCTIVTCAAGDETSEIHNRMPVILERADYARWLDPDTDTAELAEMLRPYDGGDVVCRPVSTYVNSVMNQGAECVAPKE